ncbi:DNA repair helicase XPB [Bacillus horti]|uniref:DNA 3'-5' helicase n=1 Tax=Caldalkalibacillus horti TaxID=77523 RepID=A0ABT9W3Q2_9BACI|nr:DNA repair helicase XPB [Bacillus horti]MDQ0167862.1 DNA excision repair protein ERCC-3 [Bacillus horti]
MQYNPENPVVVQSDLTLYVEVQHPLYEEVRDVLHHFAELLKSPEYIHTYRMTPLTLWNAASSGVTPEEVIQHLRAYTKFPLGSQVEASVYQTMQKYGRLCLVKEKSELYLQSTIKEYLEELVSYPSNSSFFSGKLFEFEENGSLLWKVSIHSDKRGELKQEALRIGYPIKDEAGYTSGDYLKLSLRDVLESGSTFSLRDYQVDAVEAFYQDGQTHGGQGVLVLPCGAGKTIIGIASVNKLQCATLILTTNHASVKQWKRELLEKTTLTEQDVGEYTGEMKEIKPVTIATYQVLTYKAEQEFIHLDVFQQKEWGLIIYDEVHLLPAPIFRATASIQSTRRLGLTATLIREDGREEDVFSLIGPKIYSVPWKKLEQQGYIATAFCTEVRVNFDDFMKEQYFLTNAKRQARIAQENPNKIDAVKVLLKKHEGEPTLIIGQYVEQLEQLGVLLDIPVITGKMKHAEREDLYDAFRKGEIPILAVSKVANFAIDLPDATVAIQVSGMFGSRQEEAQRLGRILRPKKGNNTCYFYHVVTKDSKDQEYALKRQLFLIEQGYRYQLVEE